MPELGIVLYPLLQHPKQTCPGQGAPALSETLQESENNESETKILSEKLKSLKVIFKYLDSFITDFCRGRFVHRDRYLEQHQTEKIDNEVKDIEDMVGYKSQKCMHPVHGAAFLGVIRACGGSINNTTEQKGGQQSTVQYI